MPLSRIYTSAAKPPIIEFRKIKNTLGSISIAISMPPVKFNNKDNRMNKRYKSRWTQSVGV